MLRQVTIHKGGVHSDNRGTLSFVNEFDFSGVCRFYQIVHPAIDVVRAWQGHKVEHKYFYVASGSFRIAWLEIDDWSSPSGGLVPQQIVLTADEPCVLSIPPGYANGMKAIEEGSILLVFSNLTVEQSEQDRWSFDPGLWMDWSLETTKDV
jgi:dTDP-4-dehydrorhamnose 3,5-epimerase